MRAFKTLVAALTITVPALLTALPAEALTARQYQHQGRGHYVSSKGRPMAGPMHRSWRHHGRHWRHHRYGR